MQNNAYLHDYERQLTNTRMNAADLLLPLFAILLVTFVNYYGSLSNFFYADDFIWLDRVTHLQGNWSSIFTIENRYFTPMTYLSFYVNHKLFGLNAYWYHLFDVIVHSFNGFLLYVLTWLLCRNKLTALIAAIAFVTSFSILITLFWPSARTDLLMVLFSLATLITFIRHGANRYRFVPVLLYVLALCAKGTALVIPVVLFLLIAGGKPLKSRIRELLPYLVINVAYASLLLLINSLGTKKITTADNIVSVANYVRSLPTLIVPERHLAGLGMPALVFICVIILVALVGLSIRLNDITVRIGTALAIFGLLPLLFTRNYVLAGSEASAITLLSSPSNRVYLAAAGIALVYAVVFAKLLQSDQRLPVRIMSALLLVSLLAVNYYEIGLCNKKWKKGTDAVKNGMAMLARNAGMLTENSVLLLYNFEGSTGFSTAMINMLYDLKKYEINAFDNRYTQVITNDARSPLNNPKYYHDAANIKLIMNCPERPHADWLIYGGNLILQNILIDYRELYATRTAAEAHPIRSRLQDNMSKLRTVLNECSFRR